jgi:hypothetical protein
MKWTAFCIAHYGQPITVQGLGKIKNDKSIPKDEAVIALEKCFKRWESMRPEQREADYDRLAVRYKKGDSAE